MGVMGWSNSAMVKRYAHVTARLLRHIADRLNAFLWTSYETKNETDTAARHDGIDRGARGRLIHRTERCSAPAP